MTWVIFLFFLLETKMLRLKVSVKSIKFDQTIFRIQGLKILPVVRIMNIIKVSLQIPRAMASSETVTLCFLEPDQLQVQDLCWIRCRDERKRNKGRLLPPPCRPVERRPGVQGAAVKEIFCGYCSPSSWPPPWTWCPRVCLAPVWSRDKKPTRATLNDRSTFQYNN